MYLSQEQIQACNGPWELQVLLNEVNDLPKPLPSQSFDKLVERVHQSMQSYKGAIDSYPKDFQPSDKKKMLALPFLMQKTTELPEPKKGQKEWNLFTTLYGKDYDHFNDLIFDQEEKITEFNYEKFIPKHLLANMDTQSAEFKTFVKALNMNMLTDYEQHLANQS